MRIRNLLLLCAGAALLASSGGATAERIKLVPYASKINTPLAMVQLSGDDRQFIVEQFGLIKILHPNGQLQAIRF
jgi:hypothetical protein